MAIAIVTYFILPREPKKAGFLKERERLIASERIRVENAGLVGPNSRKYRVGGLTPFAE